MILAIKAIPFGNNVWGAIREILTVKNRALYGLFWSLLQRLSGQGLGFIVFIVLARELDPVAFGLIGMLMVFVNVSNVIVEGGFSTALIQSPEVSQNDYSTTFWFNILLGLVVYGVLYGSAPSIAGFYQEEQLTSLVRILSLIFIINALGIVPETRLKKDLRFKSLLFIHVPATLGSGAVAIFLAYQGYGVWSLIALQLVNRVLYVSQLWLYSEWVPSTSVQWQSAKRLFAFAWKILASGIFGRIYDNTLQIIIGKYYSPTQLGYYQNAHTLVTTPTNALTAILLNVTFPAFSLVQGDRDKVRYGYKLTVQLTYFLLCPLYTLLIVLANPIFECALGAKWIPAVPYFRLLCIVGLMAPLNRLNLEMLNLKGRSDLFLQTQLVVRLATLLVILLSIEKGIYVLIAVTIISAILRYFVFSYFAGPLIGYLTKEQILDVIPAFALSIFSTSIWLLGSRLVTPESIQLQLIWGVLLILTPYLLSSILLRIPALYKLQEMATDILLSK